MREIIFALLFTSATEVVPHGSAQHPAKTTTTISQCYKLGTMQQGECITLKSTNKTVVFFLLDGIVIEIYQIDILGREKRIEIFPLGK